MVKYLFECCCAVVVEVRGSLADSMQTGDVHLVPVIRRGRSPHEAGQQSPARIGAGAANLLAVCQRDLVGTCIAREPRLAWSEGEASRRDRVYRTWTLSVDVVITPDRSLGCGLSHSAVALGAGALK